MRKIHILLIEPNYYTQFPPLSLLKLSTYHKLRGDSTELIRGFGFPKINPDKIYITSLFTYAWRPVHDVISRYRMLYPKAKIILGGIYASLMPDHALLSKADKVHIGLFEPAEELLPDYSLVPKWEASIVYSSRGCINKCPFCAVPKLEPKFKAKRSIKHLIYPKHKRVTFFDNNILASPHLDNILDELKEMNLEVDFNQGLDIRLLTPEIAYRLRGLRIHYIKIAYDRVNYRDKVRKAIGYLKEAGFGGSHIIVYLLHNFEDSPEDLHNRICDLMEWGAISYPMRYEPLDSLKKGSFVANNWTPELLEMIAKARRVLGNYGSFPFHEGLKKKILKARNFTEAFQLLPPSKHNNISLSLAGI